MNSPNFSRGNPTSIIASKTGFPHGHAAGAKLGQFKYTEEDTLHLQFADLTLMVFISLAALGYIMLRLT